MMSMRLILAHSQGISAGEQHFIRSTIRDIRKLRRLKGPGAPEVVPDWDRHLQDMLAGFKQYDRGRSTLAGYFPNFQDPAQEEP